MPVAWDRFVAGPTNPFKVIDLREGNVFAKQLTESTIEWEGAMHALFDAGWLPISSRSA